MNEPLWRLMKPWLAVFFVIAGIMLLVKLGDVDFTQECPSVHAAE